MASSAAAISSGSCPTDSWNVRAVPWKLPCTLLGMPMAAMSSSIERCASLSDAQRSIEEDMAAIGMPNNVHGSFQGTARTFQQSVGQEPLLIAAALLAIYIVLGMLYESYVHPLTVLSTLPSAGIGAVLALMLFNMEFSIIALIGIVLLIGIVKKNAILI